MKNNYHKWKKEELITYLKVLEEKIAISDATFTMNFPWAGNLGQWYWYYEKNIVKFNQKKVTTIGYDPAMIGEVGFEFFTNKLHPDDYDRVMNNMIAHLKGEVEAYEVQYRIQHKDGHYLWYYDRGTVTKRDENGKPLLLEGVVFDISESKIIESQLIELVEKDFLTGVFNRRMLFQSLDSNIKLNLSHNVPFSLIMFDIDDFKGINDHFGHLVGDEVLVKLVDVVKADKRSRDHIFRYGGDEFFILLPNTDLLGASKVAARLQEEIHRTHFPKVKDITISMGVTTYQKQNEDELLNKVDKLMYEAKKIGRGLIKVD